jgi:hypothetical protein
MYKILPILLFAYGLAVTTEDIYDNSYALIIGIDKYQNVQPLNYAVKDAEIIQDILVSTFDFPEDNVTLLKNEEATKQNILKSFSEITKKAEDSDRVLIFFAGHGETMDLPEGGEKGYLIPVEGDSEDLYLTGLPMEELRQIALISRAKHMLYLVDACYGGIAAIGSRGLDSKRTPNYIDKITKDKSRQVITAGGRGEQVIEKPEWGHSAFTLNLKRGLQDSRADYNSDGYITANELGLFLREKVTIDSDNQQTPQYGRMTSQEGEFVFINNKTTIVKDNEIKEVQTNLPQIAHTIPVKIFSQTLGFQLNEIGEKGEPEFIPIITYRKDIQSSLFFELGAGFLSVNDHSKFTLNIDLFKTFLKINNINFTFGPGANIIYKIYDDTSKKGGRIGLGFGVENTASNNLAKGHLFYFGRLYYPSYYIHTKNSTIGGSIGIMLQF